MQLIVILIMIMMSVAFFSLFERKLLSLIQNRKGPNKVGMMGIIQPFSDAIKLISKTNNNPTESSKFMYMLSPSVFMMFSLLTWMTIPWNMMNFQSSLLFLVFCLNLSVYGLISLGWFSNSKFASMGAVRSISQSISYEIILSFSLFMIMLMIMSTNITFSSEMQHKTWMLWPMTPMSIMFFISMLAETSRSPFDLSEGESELVSGFCIEYGCMSYTMIFLTENMSIMMMSLMFSFMFMNGFKMETIKFMMIVFLFVWIRGTMPRIRLDQMMSMCWTMIMPLTVMTVLLFSMLI